MPLAIYFLRTTVISVNEKVGSESLLDQVQPCLAQTMADAQLLLVHHLYQLITAQRLTWQDSGEFCYLHCFMSFSKFWTLWASRIEES